MVDLELGHIGDPMMDLAAWRMRDTVIGYGDFRALYDRYAELTGKPVDLAAIRWHHLFFTLTNQLSFHGALARPTPDTDYMTYAQWVSETNLHAVETMAEYLGINLEPVEIPGPVPSPVSTAHEHLSVRCDRSRPTTRSSPTRSASRSAWPATSSASTRSDRPSPRPTGRTCPG